MQERASGGRALNSRSDLLARASVLRAGASDCLAHSSAIFQQHTVNPPHGSRQKSEPAAPREKRRKDELGVYIPARQPEFPAVKYFSGNKSPRVWLSGPAKR